MDATGTGTLHLVAARISFTIEPIALLLLALCAASPAPLWSRLTTGAALVAIGGLIALLRQLQMGVVPGIPERVVLISLAAWECGAAAWALRGPLRRGEIA